MVTAHNNNPLMIFGIWGSFVKIIFYVKLVVGSR